MVFHHNAVLNLFLLSILHLPISVLRYGIWMFFIKYDAPFEEQLQVYLHGMNAGFHDYEITLGKRLEFIRREQRPLYHLQGLGRIVLGAADRAGHNSAAAQCL